MLSVRLKSQGGAGAAVHAPNVLRLLSSSQPGVPSDGRADPRGEEVWRHPERNIHREGRECGSAGRDREWDTRTHMQECCPSR